METYWALCRPVSRRSKDVGEFIWCSTGVRVWSVLRFVWGKRHGGTHSEWHGKQRRRTGSDGSKINAFSTERTAVIPPYTRRGWEIMCMCTQFVSEGWNLLIVIRLSTNEIRGWGWGRHGGVNDDGRFIKTGGRS